MVESQIEKKYITVVYKDKETVFQILRSSTNIGIENIIKLHFGFGFDTKFGLKNARTNVVLTTIEPNAFWAENDSTTKYEDICPVQVPRMVGWHQWRKEIILPFLCKYSLNAQSIYAARREFSSFFLLLFLSRIPHFTLLPTDLENYRSNNFRSKEKIKVLMLN